MAKCTCFELPPEMWTTHYGAVEPGSTHEPNPDCPEHFRKPPYRLDDGTWSDGVDRTSMIKLHKFQIENPSRPIVIQTWDQRPDGGYDWVAIESKYGEPEYFPTHTEAIAYADRMARTNQGENK